MTYTSKQLRKNIDPTQKKALTSPISMLSDQRASTAMQLKQQQIMHAAHSPNVIQQVTAEEEPIQGEFKNETPTQLQESTATKPNNTGLPDNLKSGIENLSGYAMDDVNVHYNSDKPAQLNAHAYAQGTDIHVAPGQEQHLPHEAWHVVQQKQGRVQPTMQMKAGVPVNDDAGLEHEADVMGARAVLASSTQLKQLLDVSNTHGSVIQNKTDVKTKLDDATDTLTASKEINTPTEGTAWYRFAKDGKNINTFSENKYSGLGTKGSANQVAAVDLKNSPDITDPSEILDMGRPKHFSLADKMIGKTDGGYREGKYTWHHMITPYKMQLVDMYTHGGFFHYGGMANWHDQDEGGDGDA